MSDADLLNLDTAEVIAAYRDENHIEDILSRELTFLSRSRAKELVKLKKKPKTRIGRTSEEK